MGISSAFMGCKKKWYPKKGPLTVAEQVAQHTVFWIKDTALVFRGSAHAQIHTHAHARDPRDLLVFQQGINRYLRNSKKETIEIPAPFTWDTYREE